MFRDLTDMTFGRLTAIKTCGQDKQNRFIWRCSCDCGATKDIRGRSLVQGLTKSCGCLAAESAAASGKLGRAKISGSKSHLYNARLTEEHRSLWRSSLRLREWRSAIFKRDNFTCDICLSRGETMNAHHLDSWAHYPDRRFDLTNGVSLCRACHHAFHQSVGGQRHPCRESQYIDFKKIAKLRANAS